MRTSWDPATDPSADPSIAILAGYSLQTTGYRILRPEGTPNWLMVYTVGGQGRAISHKKTYACVAGSFAIWAPNTRHDYGIAPSDRHWDQLWVHYVPGVRFERVLQQLTNRQTFCLLHDFDTASIQLQMQTISELPRTAMGELRAINLMDALLLDLVERSWQNTDDSPVEVARRFIASHLGEPIGLDEIAQAVGLSSSRITALFRDSLGVSPRNYLERERLNYAMQLLRLTTQSVQSISQQVGFDNPFYFTLRFKKHCGKSPTEYRKKA